MMAFPATILAIIAFSSKLFINFNFIFNSAI
jgi:hypothetical protein